MTEYYSRFIEGVIVGGAFMICIIWLRDYITDRIAP
jgi:hypothetical protein